MIVRKPSPSSLVLLVTVNMSRLGLAPHLIPLSSRMCTRSSTRLFSPPSWVRTPRLAILQIVSLRLAFDDAAEDRVGSVHGNEETADDLHHPHFVGESSVAEIDRARRGTVEDDIAALRIPHGLIVDQQVGGDAFHGQSTRVTRSPPELMGVGQGPDGTIRSADVAIRRMVGRAFDSGETSRFPGICRDGRPVVDQAERIGEH